MLIGIRLDNAVDVASRHAATPDAARTANDILKPIHSIILLTRSHSRT